MIDELNGERFIGYGCISSATYTRNDMDEVKATKAYTEIVQCFNDHGFNPECIRIDVIAGPTRKRYFLSEIIDTFRNGENWYQSPKGTVVIESLSALGTRSDIAAANYLNLVRENIGILVLGQDHAAYSTVDFGGSYILSPEECIKLADKVLEIELKSKRGSKRTTRTFSPEFKEMYWLFENYFIPESLVYNNKLHGKTTHNTFDRYCTDYEHSPEYAEDEARELANGIYDKPKRFGKPPAKFPEYCSLVVNGSMPVEEACKKLKLSPITFNRFILKGTGRQAMAKATYTYRDQKIIDAISPDPDSDK